MKKIIVLILLICIILTGCATNKFSVSDFDVSPWRPEGEYTRFEGCLSVDGQTFTFSNLDQVQLNSGDVTHLLAEYPQLAEAMPYFSYTVDYECGWTTDAALLAVTNDAEQINGRFHIIQTIIINTEDHTFSRLIDDIGAFRNWSPFSRDVIFVQESNSRSSQVYDLNTFNIITNEIQVDFRSIMNLGANGCILWSRDINYPIAYLTSTISNPYTVFVWPNLAIVSGIDTYPSMESEFVEILSDTPIAGAIFDPTGEYVLISEWVCGSVDENQPCDWNTARIADISDTILSVINWRTGERQELFRLSEVGDGNYVAYGSTMYWSADGSTILIERHNASPVVLTVQYP